MRDDAGPGSGQGRCVARLYEALRAGARWPGRVPAVPQAQFGPIKVPEGPGDERFVYLSDVLPTSWQAVEYAAIPDGGSVAVIGLGPIGQMSCRIALQRGAGNVFGIDLVDERLEMARRHGVQTIDVREHDDSSSPASCRTRSMHD